MPLTLAIENMTSLPDGGPLSVSVTGKRGLDIGRDSHLDWTLPDPTRYVSSKHCEVRWHDGGYWLHDVSTNGTILNDAGGRMTGPHRLRNGDRLGIGAYLIKVALTDEGPSASYGDPPPVAPPRAGEFWGEPEGVAPPIDPRDLRAPPERQQHSDFLDWALDAPPPLPGFDPPAADAGHAGGSVWDAPARTQPLPPASPPANDWGSDEWAVGPSENPTPAVAEAPSAPPPPEPTAAPEPDPPPRLPRIDEPPRERPAAATDSDVLRRFARGAGLPDETFDTQDPGAFAEKLGGLMALVVGDLKQLLDARAMAKRATRSAQHTTIQALDNNPLKFSPTPEHALKIMFGPPTRNYLDAQRALADTFADLKEHQVATLSATQKALQALVADLAPESIEAAVEPDRGLTGMLASRKARLWDLYVARWQAKTGPHDDGLLGAFMLYFSEHYDRSGRS